MADNNQNENQYSGIISNYQDNKNPTPEEANLSLDNGFDGQIEQSQPVSEEQAINSSPIPEAPLTQDNNSVQPEVSPQLPTIEEPQLAAQPEPSLVEPQTTPEFTPPPIVTPPSSPLETNNLEQILKNGHPTVAVADENSAPVVSSDEMKPKHSIFRVIFLVTLLIFLGVSAAVAVYLVKSNIVSLPKEITDIVNKEGKNTDDSSTNTPASSLECSLNDVVYKVGQSFPAADNCNTCTCNATGEISCTEKACITPTPASSSALPSTSTPSSSITPGVAIPTQSTNSSAPEVIDNVQLN